MNENKKKKLQIAGIVTVLVLCVVCAVVGITTTLIPTDKNTATEQAEEDININKEIYQGDIEIPYENVVGIEKVTTLGDETRDNLCKAIGNKLASNSDEAKHLHVTLLNELGSASDVPAIQMRNDSNGDEYNILFYSENISITPISQPKQTTQTTAQAPITDPGKGETTTNEGDKLQADSSQNIFVTNQKALSKVLPENVATTLSTNLEKWANGRGLEIAIYQSTIDPKSIKAQNNTTTFNILCTRKADTSYVLVNAVYNSATNTLEFAEN